MKLFIRPKKYSFPIISVGNIVTGGTGKTPLVTYLSERFIRDNFKVIVLSSAAEKSIKKYSSTERDDELRMLKEQLPGIIVESKRRDKLISVEKIAYSNKVIAIIDDGFHSHAIKKDVDILIIDASNPFDNHLIIPSGLLREPVYFAKRADVFVLSHPYMVPREQLDKIATKLKGFGRPVFVMDYEIKGLKSDKGSLPCLEIDGKEIIGLAGLGNPRNFFYLLTKLNPVKIHPIVYPDHFSYRTEDIERIALARSKNNASYIITTAKDYVKLKKIVGELPVFYLDIRSKMENFYEKKDFDRFIRSMLKL